MHCKLLPLPPVILGDTNQFGKSVQDGVEEVITSPINGQMFPNTVKLQSILPCEHCFR